MRRRASALILSALIVAVPLLAGCGQSSESPREEDARPRIALIMKSLANEFFFTMAEGARVHQGEHVEEYQLIVNGIKDERDLARQVALVEEMIANNVDAIVIAPADSKALIGVCNRAMQAGIVVINIDNKMDGDALASANVKIPFVGPDNRAGARMVGEFVARRLQPGDEVAILEGVATAFNAQQRRLGFVDAVDDAGLKIVASQNGEWEMNIGNRVAAAIISANPDLKAILCSNDSMALGALAAVKSANKQGDVLIVGFDNISAIQSAIRNQEVLATADQHAEQLAVFGIEVALQILNGAVPAQSRTTPVDLITAETLR